MECLVSGNYSLQTLMNNLEKISNVRMIIIYKVFATSLINQMLKLICFLWLNNPKLNNQLKKWGI